MNLQTRRQMLQRLSRAIGLIGTDFEHFGGKFLDHLLRTRLEHSGLNDFGFPVSRVVDSVSDDGKVVAQYGAHEGYFAGSMSKASGDIDHTLKHHPNAETIFLFADEPGRPIRIAEFRKRMLGEPRMQGKALRVWGANRIAGWILRHLLTNDTAVDELAVFLPELARIRDEFARDRLFLDLSPRHRPRPALSEEIGRRLRADPCLVISGLGGAGKSETAAAFGRDAAASYQMKIWLHREDFRGVQDLQALPLVRGGEKRNVANLLRTRACLLVVDDPDAPFEPEAMAALCGEGSHVIVTARERMRGDFPLPALLEAEARAMLEAGVREPCPDAVFAKIWQTVGGHPLTLSVMNAAALDGFSWSDLEQDCEVVGELDDRRQRLADRLLGRYHDLLFSELSVFEWLQRADVDATLIKSLIRPVGIRKLADRALTAADRPTSVRLHDLVFATLPSLHWWTNARRAEFDDQLERYCREVWDSNDVRLWSAANSTCERLLAIISQGDRRPSLLLASLTILDFHQPMPFDLGDPIAHAGAWAAAGAAVDPLEVRLAIELFEWTYLNLKERDPAAAPAWAVRGLSLFDDLAGLPGLSPRQAAEIRHHRGKALAWAGRFGEARAEFEAVMASGEPLEATRLQLLRAYKADRDFEQAVDFGDAVIAAAERGDDISATVLLGVLESMPWRDPYARTKVLRPRERFIVKTIIDHALLGYNQAYQALATVARYWSTEAPAVLTKVLAAIPAPDITQFRTDRERSEMADILLEAGRSQASPEREATFARALSFFDSASTLSDFFAQRRAELLIEMGRAGEAEAILQARPDLEEMGYVQRLLANALLQLGRSAEARPWIDRALKDSRCQSHYHEFFKLRFHIRKAQGDEDAIEDLRHACDLSAEGAVKEEWCALLAAEGASLG